MRWVVAGCVIFAFGCGSVESDSKSCPEDLDKRFFVEDVTSRDDDPVFTVRVEVVDPPAFTSMQSQLEARFEITETMLVAFGDGDERVVAVFPVIHHGVEPCEPHHNTTHDELGSWYLRPWLRVDWGLNLVDDHARIDRASAAGYPDAAKYVPVAGSSEPELALESGYLAATTRFRIEWQDIDEQTPGCIYDFPSWDPALPCPDVLVTERWEFRRPRNGG